MSEDGLRPVIVAKKVNEAHNMASFELVDPDGAELPRFSAGSHIDVTISDGLVRQYSLCNSASERHRYLIGVWRDANSRGGSKRMHDAVKEGDTLKVGLPRNQFRVPKSTKRAVLLARGIGLTPILSIADDLQSKGIPFALHYVFAMMSPGAFEGRIKESAFAENARFYLRIPSRTGCSTRQSSSRSSPRTPSSSSAASTGGRTRSSRPRSRKVGPRSAFTWSASRPSWRRLRSTRSST